MKKLLLLLLVSTSVTLKAQTLLEENFNTLPTPFVLPIGWTSTNLSSPIGTGSWSAGSTATFNAFEGPATGYLAVNYNSGAGVSTLNNWIMTPTVSVQNGDQVSFYTRVPDASSWADRIELRQSISGSASTNPTGLTDVGSYATLCLTVNSNLVAAQYPSTWTKFTYVVTGLTGQVSSRFALRYTVPDGGPSGNNSNFVGIDAFQVKRPIQNDLSLNAVTVPAYLPTGNFSFVGQVGNQGTNAVTSYQVSWQSNNGVVNTYNVTGVNIAPGATHDFTHNLSLNAVSGQAYTFNFNVSTVNGVADGDSSNNSLTGASQVPSGSTTFKPMIEKFTGSTCGPCASYNGSTFNAFYTAENLNFNYVAYQMNWPGTGDPYYTAEGGVRRNYYGVNAITSLWIGGSEYSTSNNQAAITAHITAQSAKTAYFEMTGTRNFTGNNAAVTYNITPYLSGTYVLYAAVIEKTTTGNVATNGETQFKHVMMKMVPNANGTSLTMTAGVPVSGSISASLAGTFVEQITDCEVILYLQNPTTKEIMQSYKAADFLSTSSNTLAETVKLYPNPASDIIRLSNVEKVNIEISDLMGKTVLTLNDVTDQTSINVSALQSGVYLFTVKNETVNQTIKFVKK
jgi:hypothetical protein